ncbi:hypothetical protein V8C86DRAFT_2442640 [Haematococcus lacustris]
MVTMDRVENVESAACIIVPVHHSNHYFFVVYFRQVKRVVFFDSGKRFNPSWPDTFTEMGWHFFSDELEPWVFEEGTITQQPDAIHCADHVLSGINAVLQAEDVRYCRNIDLAHINMASQRLRWLQPFLWVTVERMKAEQARAQADNADNLEPPAIEVAGTAAPQEVVAAELGSNPPAETPHAGAALAATSSASPRRGADEVEAGTAGPAKASPGWPQRAHGEWWGLRGRPIKHTEPDVGRTVGPTSPPRTGPGVVEQLNP